MALLKNRWIESYISAVCKENYAYWVTEHYEMHIFSISIDTVSNIIIKTAVKV